MTMADRIVVMNNGKVEQVGSPVELYDHPVNIFVAQFLGSPPMNSFKGNLLEKNQLLFFVSGESLCLPMPFKYSHLKGKELIYGVRPENIIIHTTPVEDGIPAVVELVELTGSLTEITLSIDQIQFIVLHTGRTNIVPGQEIQLLIQADSIKLFEAISGERVF
jgi:multiple sugar transport system ATP-binding protein